MYIKLKIDYRDVNLLNPSNFSQTDQHLTKRGTKRKYIKKVQEKTCLYSMNTNVDFLNVFCSESYKIECERHRREDTVSFEDFLEQTTSVPSTSTNEVSYSSSAADSNSELPLLPIEECHITLEVIKQYVVREINHSIKLDRDIGGCYWFINQIYEAVRHAFLDTDIRRTLSRSDEDLIIGFLNRVKCRHGISQRMFTHFDSALVNAFKIWQLLVSYFGVRNDVMNPDLMNWNEHMTTVETNATYQKKCANNYFKRKPIYTSLRHRSITWWKSVCAKLEDESFLIQTLTGAVSKYFPTESTTEADSSSSSSISLLPGNMPIDGGKSGFSRKILELFKNSTTLHGSLIEMCETFTNYVRLINKDTSDISCSDLITQNTVATVHIFPEKSITKRFNTKKIKRSLSSEQTRMMRDPIYQMAVSALTEIRSVYQQQRPIDAAAAAAVYTADMSRYILDFDTNELLLKPPIEEEEKGKEEEIQSHIPEIEIEEEEDDVEMSKFSNQVLSVLTSSESKNVFSLSDELFSEVDNHEFF